jgi:tetraacyldisaccharide 4'-kinase
VSLKIRLREQVLRAVVVDRPTLTQRAARGALAMAALGYGAGVRLRNAAYDLGLLRIGRLPCGVVCVGNLTAGGTGKTPTVIMLGRRLTDGGRKVTVLLRGYGRAGSGVEVVSDGRDLCLDWWRAGDEALLLGKRLPGVPIVVGGDRLAAGRLAVQRFGSDTLLLDDGFQHRRLHRDLDLVMLDATDPFGGGRLLPRGLLREPAAALRRAHAIILSRTDQVAEIAGIRRRLEQMIPDVPHILTRHRPSGLNELPGGDERSLESLRGRRVLAVSGIANPRGFHRTLADLGAILPMMLTFPDHHPYGAADLLRVEGAAREAGAELIVTTEKDAVRMPAGMASLPILALRVDLEITEGAETLERLLMRAVGGIRG